MRRPDERSSQREAQPSQGRAAGNADGVALRTVNQVGRFTKAELIRLAGQLDVADSSTMNKQDLVQAVVRVGGVPWTGSTRRTCCGWAGNRCELQTSMTKPELIAAVSTSRAAG